MSLDQRRDDIVQEIRTSATPGQVWEAWTRAERLAGWFPERAVGDARPGATMVWHFDDFGASMPVEVLELEQERRLLLGLGAARIEVEIGPPGASTRVRVVHSGFTAGADWDAEYEGAASGWRMALALLAHYCERHFGEPRAVFLAVAPAQVERGRLPRLFREADGLAQWLARSGSIGPEGSEFALELEDGERLSGEVLAHTSFETALSWREERGALELKSFEMPGRGSVVGVRGSGWGMDVGRAASWRGRFERALERLAAVIERG